MNVDKIVSDFITVTVVEKAESGLSYDDFLIYRVAGANRVYATLAQQAVENNNLVRATQLLEIMIRLYSLSPDDLFIIEKEEHEE